MRAAKVPTYSCAASSWRQTRWWARGWLPNCQFLWKTLSRRGGGDEQSPGDGMSDTRWDHWWWDHWWWDHWPVGEEGWRIFFTFVRFRCASSCIRCASSALCDGIDYLWFIVQGCTYFSYFVILIRTGNFVVPMQTKITRLKCLIFFWYLEVAQQLQSFASQRCSLHWLHRAGRRSKHQAVSGGRPKTIAQLRETLQRSLILMCIAIPWLLDDS